VVVQDPADVVSSEKMVAADMLDFLEAFFEGEGSWQGVGGVLGGGAGGGVKRAVGGGGRGVRRGAGRRS
jgi:hypothetical protein